MRKTSKRPLFAITPKQDKVEEPVIKKRGRHKKEVEPVPDKKKVDEVNLPKTKQNKIPEIKRPKTGWKIFGKTMEQRPEPLVPCEFKFVNYKNEESYMYGFVGYDGLIGTDNPYVLNRLKEKATKFLYRQLDCHSIDNCPNGFPNCEKCKGVKT